jgi:hypothetical protein
LRVLICTPPDVEAYGGADIVFFAIVVEVRVACVLAVVVAVMGICGVCS